MFEADFVLRRDSTTAEVSKPSMPTDSLLSHTRVDYFLIW